MQTKLYVTLFGLIFFCACDTNKNLYRALDSPRIDTLTVAGDTYRVKWLLKEDFASDERLKNWVLEATKADMEIKDGKLFITDYGIGSTLWYKKEFPPNIIIRYTTRSEKGMADNKLNFNHISHACENDGTPLKIGEESGRTGAYSQYHQFTNYIATLTFKHSRLRKDPGFRLLSDSETHAVENQRYEVVYTVLQGRLRYYLNNLKVHDKQDPEPLKGGKFGLRTWNTHASWDNIEIGVIL
ncbi:hypothetical protein G5B00_15915 [Parapedobacter sp. SGR-10]|uniref:DUF6250 domain-containing protein n=1 Tax=Parapedobacter sp. SGR-10 TaxID=2710879 RepID=UPI0013D8D6F5|nr:DUF6250 domain-containing protein [Parapedobacter sp. SGR-10]NGF58003.1 hypothetical protein [Parapedobacter sp. SGR-10]